MKMRCGLMSVRLIFCTPCTSMSSTHTFPARCTLRTASTLYYYGYMSVSIQTGRLDPSIHILPQHTPPKPTS